MRFALGPAEPSGRAAPSAVLLLRCPCGDGAPEGAPAWPDCWAGILAGTVTRMESHTAARRIFPASKRFHDAPFPFPRAPLGRLIWQLPLASRMAGIDSAPKEPNPAHTGSSIAQNGRIGNWKFSETKRAETTTGPPRPAENCRPGNRSANRCPG